MILSQNRTDVFIDTKKCSHRGSPTNLTITFADYFYSKCYCGRSMASANAKCEATAHAAGHNHRRKGPARFRSLDFSKHNGYLKDPARFRSLDFGERNGYFKGPARFRSLNFGKRNGYLKGVAPIDAQQKSMELLTFSCSRGSSWVGTLPLRYGHHGWKRSHQTL